MIISDCFHTSSALARIFAPTAVYASSGKPLPRPPPRSMNTVCPAVTSASAPAGTRAMRFSFVLISLGTPISMGPRSWLREGDESNGGFQLSLFTVRAGIGGSESNNRLPVGREEFRSPRPRPPRP